MCCVWCPWRPLLRYWHRLRLRYGLRKRWARRKPREQPLQVWRGRAPVKLRETEVEKTKRAACGHIPKPEPDVSEPLLLAQQARQFGYTRLYFFALTRYPIRTLHGGGARALQPDQHDRIADAVGDRLDLFVRNAQIG